MTLEQIYNLLARKFPNVIRKPGKIWLVTGGDLYVIRLKAGKLHIRRNWWNPALWLTVGAIELGFIKLMSGWLRLGLSAGQELGLWAVLLALSVFFAARNNSVQRRFISDLRRYLEQNLRQKTEANTSAFRQKNNNA